MQQSHFSKLTLSDYVPQIFSLCRSMVCLTDFQKPTDEQLKEWAHMLRSEQSILKKFVSQYSFLLCHEISFFCVSRTTTTCTCNKNINSKHFSTFLEQTLAELCILYFCPLIVADVVCSTLYLFAAAVREQ